MERVQDLKPRRPRRGRKVRQFGGLGGRGGERVDILSTFFVAAATDSASLPAEAALAPDGVTEMMAAGLLVCDHRTEGLAPTVSLTDAGVLAVAGHWLNLEAMISRCLSHAMFNGQFSDDTGDACAHEYAGATKLVEAVAEARSRPELGEALYVFTDTLYQAIGAGAAMDCEQDFLALKPPAP